MRIMSGYTHPLAFDLGCGWMYGAAGMNWVGRIIEVVSKMSIEEFMQKNRFSKISMQDTTFHPALRPDFSGSQMEMAWRDRATGVLSGGKSLWGFPAKDCCSGVGLYDTPSDYAKLLKCILAGGEPIMKKKSLDDILSPQLKDPKYFLEVLKGPARAQLGQTWPAGAQATFGLSPIINLKDFPGRRVKWSANWSGMIRGQI